MYEAIRKVIFLGEITEWVSQLEMYANYPHRN